MKICLWKDGKVTPRAGVWIETFFYLLLYFKLHVTPRAGVWIETFCSEFLKYGIKVTPRAGVWIETLSTVKIFPWIVTSHPARVCGLKRVWRSRIKILGEVTPRAGVWIETDEEDNTEAPGFVTPRAGVWIETSNQQNLEEQKKSHPARVCGLKQGLSILYYF